MKTTFAKRTVAVTLLRLLHRVCSGGGRATDTMSCPFGSHTLPNTSVVPFLDIAPSAEEAKCTEQWLLLSAQGLFFQH